MGPNGLTTRTLEHHLSIQATHTGRAVRLLFILRETPYQDGAWELRGPIEIAPGESLSRLTEAVRSLVSPDS